MSTTDHRTPATTTTAPPPVYALSPGQILLEWIEDNCISSEDVAFRLNLMDWQLDLLLAGELVVTEALAEDLETLTEISARTWLTYEKNFVADLQRFALDLRLDAHRRPVAGEPVRFVGGKSARLLRGGETVALRDLTDDPASNGSFEIDSVVAYDEVAMVICSKDGNCHVVDGSRLIFVQRGI